MKTKDKLNMSEQTSKFKQLIYLLITTWIGFILWTIIMLAAHAYFNMQTTPWIFSYFIGVAALFWRLIHYAYGK